MSTANTLLVLITYLVCVSSVLGLTFVGDTEQIIIGQVPVEPRSQTTVFTNYDNISQLSVIIESGAWNVSNTKGLYSIETTSGWWIFNRIEENTIIFTDLLSNDSTFTNQYHIQNPNLNDIDIIVAYDISPLFFIANPEQLKVTIRDEGIQYRNAFYNTSKTSEFNITTTFNFSVGTLEVDLEDLTIIDGTVNSPISRQFGDFYAGGVTAYGNDTRILSLSSYIVPPSIEEETSFSMSEFLNIIAMLFFWTVPSDILPLYLNIVFIKVPLIALTFIIIQTFRGTG